MFHEHQHTANQISAFQAKLDLGLRFGQLVPPHIQVHRSISKLGVIDFEVPRHYRRT